MKMFLLLGALLLQDDKPADPAKWGPLKFAQFDEKIPRKKGGDAAAQVHHPSAGQGPFPTIVLSPGGGAETPQGYEGFGKWLASWGYVTVIVGFNNDSADERGAQYSEVLDWLEKKNSEDGWTLKGKIDTKKFVASGHSRGGWACVVAAAKDKRFIACLALAPSGPEKVEGENKPAICFLSGDGDADTCESLYKQFAKPRFQVTIEGMDHFFKPKEKIPLLFKYATAFLNYKVKGDSKYKEFLKEQDSVKVKSED